MTAWALFCHDFDLSKGINILSEKCPVVLDHYNGNLFGEWMELESYFDEDEFLEACRELHSDEEDPELMFQDYEDFPRDWYGESSINSLAFDFANDDEIELDVLEAFLSNWGEFREDWDSLKEKIQESYCGDYSSSWNPKVSYATELFDEIYGSEVPDFIMGYIDYEAFSRDLFIGDYWESNGLIFRCI